MSGWLRQIWERVLGLPTVEPGQLSRWTWTGHLPWPAELPAPIVSLLFIGLAIVVTEFYRRDARTLGALKQTVLVGFRCAELALLLVVLAQVSLSVERTGLPMVIVLLDDSASMSLRDAYSNPADRKFVTAFLDSKRASQGNEAERFELARRILLRDGAHWLREIRKHHNLRVEQFSTDAVPISDHVVDETSLERVVSEIERLQPTGTMTRPAEAVRQVLNQTRGMPPAAIVVLTDGIASTGDADRLSAVAPLARERLVPLFVVGIGSDQPSRDVQLAEVMADEVAFVNDPLVFSTKIKAFGFSGQTATVELKRSGDRRSVVRRSITLPVDGQTMTADLLFTPTEPGEHEFELLVISPPGDVNQDNNRLRQRVHVREGKLNILLADGLPRWEFRELKNTLEREPTIQLHTFLQEADLEYALLDETARALHGRFPMTPEALTAYDVIILGDLNPGAFPTGVLEHLRDYVRNGGGLLVIAGPEHTPLEFRGTPLETLLPIELETTRIPATDAEFREAFQPRWTDAGRVSVPLFRHLQLETFAGDNKSAASPTDVWRSLPGLYWLIESPRLRAGATVLLENPQRRGEKQALPVVALQRFGMGKVLFHATDELWRWRFRDGERIYVRYWIQALRFLSRTQNVGGTRGLEFTSDRQVYQRGEPVKLRLQVFDERQLSTNGPATVMLERGDEPRRSVQLSRAVNSSNIFNGELRDLREGHYHVWLSDSAVPGTPPAVDFVIEAPQRELLHRRLERADLEAAARATHGRYFELHEADRLPAEIPAGQPVPLSAATTIPVWNRWELLLIFAALLTAEWLCRRRWRLI